MTVWKKNVAMEVRSSQLRVANAEQVYDLAKTTLFLETLRHNRLMMSAIMLSSTDIRAIH